MLLSILIPTYNRADFLLKNLELLYDFMINLKCAYDIEVIVSNNCSSDDTDELIQEFITKHPLFSLCYYKQSENIGLEANALFVLDKSEAEYIMYLGDDDYIARDYLHGVLEIIKSNKTIFCVLPSTLSVFPDGSTKPGKDYLSNNKIFEPGFNNVLVNARKGTQLSGVIHKRDGMLSAYKENKVSNIYPFVFFVGLNSLRGKTKYLFNYPVRVSTPPQALKDWDYGKDGLIPDIFDNFNKIPRISKFEKIKLGIDFLRREHWRFTKYYSNGGLKSLNELILWNLKSKNIPFFIKLLIPFIFYFYSIRSK